MMNTLESHSARRDITVGAQGNNAPPMESVIKAAQRNEQQGYDAIWWPDHLMNWWPRSIWTPDIAPPAKYRRSPHMFLDPVATIGAVGTQTERVMLGTSVTDAIRRPPAMLAQEFLTLDHITKGRVILGLGAGENCNLGPYGIDGSKPISRLEEALEIVRLLWESDEPVNYDGQFHRLRDAVNDLPPYRPGRFPPIWIGALAPRTIRIIGRLADGWLPPFALTRQEYAERVGWIHESARQAGRDPEAIVLGLWAYVVVDEDHEACHRMLESPLVKDVCLALSSEFFERRGFGHPLGDRVSLHEFVPSRFSREAALDACRRLPFEIVHELIVHGSPEDMVERFRPYIDAGARHIALNNLTVADDTKLSSSFRLMAEFVKQVKAL